MQEVLKVLDRRVSKLRKGLERMEDARATKPSLEAFQDTLTRIDELETIRNILRLPQKQFNIKKRSENG